MKTYMKTYWISFLDICAWSFLSKLSSPFSSCFAIQSETQIDCIWHPGILHVPDIDFPLSCNIPAAWQVVQNTKLLVTGEKSGNLTGSDDKCLAGPSHCLSGNGATKSTKTNNINPFFTVKLTIVKPIHDCLILQRCVCLNSYILFSFLSPRKIIFALQCRYLMLVLLLYSC